MGSFLNRLSTRLVLSLALSLVAVVVLLVVVSIQYQQQRLTEQVEKELVFITENYGHGIEAALASRFDALSDVADQMALQSGFANNDFPPMAGVRRLFRSLWFIDQAGTIRGAWHPGGELSIGQNISNNHLMEWVDHGDFALQISDPHRCGIVGLDNSEADENEVVVHITLPVLQNELQVGVLVGNLSLTSDTIFQQIKEASLSSRGFLALSSMAGLVMSHPSVAMLADVPEAQLQLMSNAFAEGQVRAQVTESQGERWLQTFYRIRNAPWVLGAAIPLNEALAPVYDLRRIQLLTGGISSLLILLLISVIVRVQLKPLKKLRNEVNLIRNNSGYRLSEVNTAELDELAQAFNRLIDNNEQQRRQSFQRQAYLNMVLSTSSAGHFMANSAGEIEYVNETLMAITGYDEQDIVKGALIEKSVSSDKNDVRSRWLEAIAEQKEIELEFEFNTASNKQIWLLVEIKPVFDHGTCLGHVGTVTDVTEQNSEIHDLRSKVHIDELTEILNRRGIEEVMQKNWNESRLFNKTYTLMALDLDNFKTVNDEHGHEAGDYVLVEVAKVLTHAVRDSDWVGRLGGDEFVIVLPGCPAKRAESIADTILQQIPKITEARSLPEVTVSIGITEVQAHDQSEVDVLRRADKAAYQAKHAGRNRWNRG
ncbi:sensor domain-containing diguanylate cyclase [Aliidiomarina celeris]|uniref:sensor domain-containing diguanylate cyclase n=1 Tax=Aliidiomarina celeris TaxID=2249428 RepID=UPI000DE82D30|nr:diguanylate cyclase [Aliidiomarina celeris]